MAASNIGTGITRFNVGMNASVSSSGIGMHVPVTPTSFTNSGNYTTTADGQVVAARSVPNGVIVVKHNNVTIINSEAMGVWIDTDKMGTKMQWSDFIVANGAVENDWGTTGIKGGDYTMVRCSMAGWIDHTRPQWGDTKTIETWYGPSYKDPTGHTNNTPAHCDPSQPHPPPGNQPFKSYLVQGCKFEIFPFQDRNAGYLAQIGIYNSNLMSTCGLVNNEFYKCPNGIFRDNHWKGNASQIVMLQNGDNNTTTGQASGTPLPPMEGWAVFDNIFDFTGQPAFGSTRAFCNFGNYTGHVAPTIEWGRNVDINGNTLAAFYRTVQSTNAWSKTKPAKPASEYISFYGTTAPPPPDGGGGSTPPPDPVIQLKVTDPASGGSTYQSGTLLFKGSADTASGDLDTNYDWYDYHVVFPDEVQPNGETGTGRIWLDHDSPTNNTGFTFTTISSSGVTFTRRGGSAPETHLGRAQLVVVGQRKNSSTWPEAQVEVTFGDTTPPAPPPPATNIAIQVDTNFEVRAVPKLKTAVGGIPKAQVTQIPVQIPLGTRTVWIAVWDSTKGGTGEEVVPLDANNYKRRYE